MIKVTSEVQCYEVNGQECTGPRVRVDSHWNRDAMVVLDIDGKRYTVSASDLIAALHNATNTACHG